MHFFTPILRCIVARVGSTFYLWSSSAANATNRSLGGVKCNPGNNNSGIRCTSSRLRLLITVTWLVSFASPSMSETITLTRPPAVGYSLNGTLYPDATSVANKICEYPGTTVDHILYGLSRAPGYQPDIRVWCYSTIPPPDWRGEVGWSNWGEFCNLDFGWDWGTNGQCILTLPDTAPIPDKNDGDPDLCGGGSGSVGNPINTGTGNKFQLETDYVAPDNSGLAFRRAYNSSPDMVYRNYYRCAETMPAGAIWKTNQNGYYGDVCVINPGIYLLRARWTHSYDRRISASYVAGATTGLAVTNRPDGKSIRFNLISGSWTPDRDIADRLVRLSDGIGNTTGWMLTLAADSSIENYAADGKLMSIVSRSGLTQTLAYTNGLLATVTDAFGRQLSFAYDGSSRMISMTDPVGQIYTYGYTSAGMISTVTYPDTTPGNSADNPRRNYLYNEMGLTAINLPNALTGIVDENGVRFATWTYDSQGRAVSSEHAGGAEKVTISHSADHSASVVSDYKDSAATPNATRNYSFQTVLNVVKSTGVSQPCASGCGSGAAAITHHSYWGYVTRRTDFNGNMTTYAYDSARQLETQRIEGLNSIGDPTSQTRTITSEWHPTWRVMKRMAEPKRLTGYVWNGTAACSVRL